MKHPVEFMLMREIPKCLDGLREDSGWSHDDQDNLAHTILWHILGCHWRQITNEQMNCLNGLWQENDMGIYYGLIGFIGLCSLAATGMNDKHQRNKIIILFACFGIAIIQGLRKITVGIDLPGYIRALRTAKDMDFFSGDKLYNYEIGYSLYSQLFARLNFSDQAYLFVVALTIILPIGYVWIKYSRMPGLSAFIYITLGFFVFSFSGLRQAIAIAITFYSYKYIVDKKRVKFLGCIVLAMSFHSSAIVFLIAYTLYHVNLKPVHFLIVIPGFILTFIFRSKIFLIIHKIYLGHEGRLESNNAYTMLVIMIAVIILSYVFGNEKKGKLNLNAYKNYMLAAVFFQIFASQSNIAMRAGYYYYIFITLLIPEIIKEQSDKKMRLVVSLLLVMSLLYFFNNTLLSGYLHVTPYYFYWM